MNGNLIKCLEGRRIDRHLLMRLEEDLPVRTVASVASVASPCLHPFLSLWAGGNIRKQSLSIVGWTEGRLAWGISMCREAETNQILNPNLDSLKEILSVCVKFIDEQKALALPVCCSLHTRGQ